MLGVHGRSDYTEQPEQRRGNGDTRQQTSCEAQRIGWLIEVREVELGKGGVEPVKGHTEKKESQQCDDRLGSKALGSPTLEQEEGEQGEQKAAIDAGHARF
ncbi:MAG: hypothetical protein M3R24_11855 [Chloroflexota bacterium]|nr:hypothetical protein [Chloroflexota bacterium]